MQIFEEKTLGPFPPLFGEGNGDPLQNSCLEDPHGQRSLVGYSSGVMKRQDWETSRLQFYVFFSLREKFGMWETQVQSLGQEDLLEKEMATHSSILAWKIPWTEEPGGLPSLGSWRVGHDWTISFSLWSWTPYCQIQI